MFLKNKYLIFLISLLFLSINAAEKAENLELNQIVQLDFGNNKIIPLTKKSALQSKLLKNVLKTDNSRLIKLPDFASEFYEIFVTRIVHLLNNRGSFVWYDYSMDESIEVINASDYFDIDCLLGDFLYDMAKNLFFKSSKNEDNPANMFNDIFEHFENIKSEDFKHKFKWICLNQLLRDKSSYNGDYYEYCGYRWTAQNLFKDINSFYFKSGNFKSRSTFLIIAANNGDLEIVKFLLYLNADKNIKNGSDKTALDIVQENMRRHTNQTLIEIENLLKN